MHSRPSVSPRATRSAFSPFVLLAALPLLLAGTGTAHADTYTLDPLTVTASRFERPLATTPASVTVLDAADLAPYATSPLEDILATLGNVTMARGGGPGQQTSLFMRGANSNAVLVLVDGVKINGATFGGANVQDLRGADIARIEIVRGPASTLYGSEAVGGVISITTRRASAAAGTSTVVDSGSLRVEGGSDHTSDLRAAGAHDDGDNHLAVGVGQYRTDGDPVTDRTETDGRHLNTSGTLNAATKTGDTRIGVDAWQARGSVRYVDCVYDASFNCVGTTPLNQDFRNDAFSLWSSTAFGNNSTVRTRIGQADDVLDQQETADYARTHRLSGTVEAEHRTTGEQGGNVAVAGIDAEREQADAVIYGSPLDTVNRDRALFARDDWTHGRHQLALGLRASEYESFGGHTTGAANYGLRIADNGFAWIAGGSAFRAPDAVERFGYGGNPALKPEESTSGEIGLRWRVAAQQFSIAGFHQRIDDLIDYPAPAFTATNIAHALNQGLELGWSWRTATTQLEVQATQQHPVDADTGTALARRPDKQFAASARQQVGNSVELRAGLRAMGPRPNSPYDNVVLPGFAVLDLGAAWTLQPGLVLDARVENAGDTRYMLASGSTGNFLMPDRAYFVGIDWHFDRVRNK